MENFFNFIKLCYKDENILTLLADWIGYYFFNYSNNFKNYMIHSFFIKDNINLKFISIIDLEIKKLCNDIPEFSTQFHDLCKCLSDLKYNSLFLLNTKIQILFWNNKYRIIDIDKDFLSNQDISYIKSLKSKIKYKKTNIPKILKIKVWNKYIGEEIGKHLCLCCNYNYITQSNFECGHIISEFNGGKTDINNLIPICSICNKSMSSKNFNNFIKTI